MKEFLILIRGGQERYETASPNDMQKHMEDWQLWMRGLAKEDYLIGGHPLLNEGSTMTDRGKKIIEQPFAKGKNLIGGCFNFF